MTLEERDEVCAAGRPIRARACCAFYTRYAFYTLCAYVSALAAAALTAP